MNTKQSKHIRHPQLIFSEEPTASPHCSPVADFTDVLGILLISIYLFTNFNSSRPNAHICCCSAAAAAADDEPRPAIKIVRKPVIPHAASSAFAATASDRRRSAVRSSGRDGLARRRRQRFPSAEREEGPAEEIDVAIL